MKKECPTSWRLQFFKRENWLKTQSRHSKNTERLRADRQKHTEKWEVCDLRCCHLLSEIWGLLAPRERHSPELFLHWTGSPQHWHTHTGTFAISASITHTINKNIVKESSHTHPSADGEFDTHTASLCSSRSLRTRVWAEVSSSQFSSSGTFTMWSRVLQPCTQTRANWIRISSAG